MAKLTDHGCSGFMFGVRIFTPVFFIASFFFMGVPAHFNLPTLTALGQFFCIAVGGGCIVPWAVIPAATITGTYPIEIARRNLLPTILGLVGVIIVGIIML